MATEQKLLILYILISRKIYFHIKTLFSTALVYDIGFKQL